MRTDRAWRGVWHRATTLVSANLFMTHALGSSLNLRPPRMAGPTADLKPQTNVQPGAGGQSSRVKGRVPPCARGGACRGRSGAGGGHQSLTQKGTSARGPEPDGVKGTPSTGHRALKQKHLGEGQCGSVTKAGARVGTAGSQGASWVVAGSLLPSLTPKSKPPEGSE